MPAEGSNCNAVQSCVRGYGLVAFFSDYVASQPTPLIQATQSLCSSYARMSFASSDLVAHFQRRGRLPPWRCRLLTAACASSVLCLEDYLTSQECAHTFHDVCLQEWAIAKVWGHNDSCRCVVHVLRQYSALLCCPPYMSSKIGRTTCVHRRSVSFWPFKELHLLHSSLPDVQARRRPSPRRPGHRRRR